MSKNGSQQIPESEYNLNPELIHLLPSQILVNPQFEMWGDIDPESGAEGDGDEAVKQIAASMERDGQVDPIVVIPTSNPDNPEEEQFTVLSGHRRRRAALFINEKRSREGKPLFRLLARVDRDAAHNIQDLQRKALIPNLHRKNFTLLHLAHVVDRLKQLPEFADDFKQKAIAKYLGVSPALVSTAIQLNKGLSVKLKRAVLRGELSVQSAQLIMSQTETHKEQEQVAERAKEIQIQQDVEAVAADVAEDRISAEEAQAKVEAVGKKKRVERGAVKAAVQEQAAQKGPKASGGDEAEDKQDGKGKQGKGKGSMPEWAKSKRTNKEIREFAELLDSPVYGPKNSTARQFARYFLGWLEGSGTQKTLVEKFDGILSAESTEGWERELEKAEPKATPDKDPKAKAKAPKAPKPAKKDKAAKPKAPKAPKVPKAPKPQKAAKTPKPAKN
jgi:ParB/RepB/Spo0J family partition protein